MNLLVIHSQVSTCYSQVSLYIIHCISTRTEVFKRIINVIAKNVLEVLRRRIFFMNTTKDTTMILLSAYEEK